MSQSYEKVQLTPAQLASLLDEREVELELATGTVKLMLPSDEEIVRDEDAAELIFDASTALGFGVNNALDEIEEEAAQ